MTDLGFIKSLFLGVVQGITEFLPVSSSAHLILISWFQNGKPLALFLNTALHIGTLASILCYFWRDWLGLLSGLMQKKKSPLQFEKSKNLLFNLLIGSIPAGFFGLSFKKEIESYFHHPSSTILPLAIFGFILWYSDKTSKKHKSIGDMQKAQAFMIGLCQAMALIPGVSRSAATIWGARVLSFNRKEAARFSFLLGTPAMFGAGLLHIKEFTLYYHEADFLTAVTSSFIVGLLSIQFFLKFIEKFGFLIFAIYRLILALVLSFLVLRY